MQSVKTAEDVARLLAEKGLPDRRGGPLVWAWIIAIPMLWFGLVVAFFGGDWAWFWGLLLALTTARAESAHSWQAATSRAALLLPELDEAWLGPLIDALTYPSSAVRAIARLRLTTVLPTLRDTDSERLSTGQRSLLFDQLTPLQALRQPDFIKAVLYFGSVSGDEQALAGTEHLAGMRAFNTAQRRVRSAARICLPDLESRVVERAATQDTARPGDESPAASRDEPQLLLGPAANEWIREIDLESGRRPGMRFAFLLASWGIIVPYMLYQAVVQWRGGSLLLSIVCASCGAVATQLYRFTLTPRQARLASKMADVDNVEAVGPLAEMTAWPDARIQAIARSALIRLLPRLKTGDAQLLDTSQRLLLYETLKLENARRQAEFQIALLAGLEQVGDIAALPYVRGLASEVPKTLRQRRVGEAAQACLPFLEGCAQNNRNSQVLLRAVPEAMSESLLRPAGRYAEPAPELLVRAAAPSEPAS